MSSILPSTSSRPANPDSPRIIVLSAVASLNRPKTIGPAQVLQPPPNVVLSHRSARAIRVQPLLDRRDRMAGGLKQDRMNPQLTRSGDMRRVVVEKHDLLWLHPTALPGQ